MIVTSFGSCSVVTDPYVEIPVIIKNWGVVDSTVKFTGHDLSVVTNRGRVSVAVLTITFSMKSNLFALIKCMPTPAKYTLLDYIMPGLKPMSYYVIYVVYMLVVCVWCTCVHTQSTSALPPEMGGAACSMAHTWRHKTNTKHYYTKQTLTQNKHKTLLHKTYNYTKQTQNVISQSKDNYKKQTQSVITTCNMLTWQLCFVHIQPHAFYFYRHIQPSRIVDSSCREVTTVFLMGGCVAVWLVVLAAVVQLPSSKETIHL